MANFYKNAFYAPTTTAVTSVYTAPSNARAIIQNIQVTNESGSKIFKTSITDSSNTSTIQIAYASITGPTICNVAKGPIIKQTKKKRPGQIRKKWLPKRKKLKAYRGQGN